MLTAKNDTFEEIRTMLDSIPVIESHEHYTGLCSENQQYDGLKFIVDMGYHPSDLLSATMDYKNKDKGQPESLAANLKNTEIPIKKRYKTWEKYYQRTCHTGYFKAMEEGVKACWEIPDLSLKSLLELEEKLNLQRDQKFYNKIYKKYKIKSMIVNTDLYQIMTKKAPYNDKICKFVFDLPSYHNIHSISNLQRTPITESLGRNIVTLDDYLEGFDKYLQQAIKFGIVGIKDQTAYRREIRYENTSRAEAEKIFNRIISNPREIFSSQEARCLDDFLFHHFMRLAAKYDLPVQIHTGHMAGIRNEISKTNATLLTSVFELHQDVVFDLFHGNWPYLGEFLFLGKNYPNVMLDMCWVNAIDPLYSVEFFKRALVTVPHSKISAFGGDTGSLETQIGYLIQAKDNIAVALSEMVDSGWINMDAAHQISEDWLFNNPNRIFKLGLKM